MADWIDLTRLSVALILLVAFVAKVVDGPKSFGESISRYGVVPPRLTASIAYLTLLAEGACGIGLLLRAHVVVFLVLAGLIFLGFGLLGLAAIRHNEDQGRVDCGCLGKHVSLRLDTFTAVKNVAVGALCTGGAWALSANGSRLGAQSDLTPVVLAACAMLVTGIYWLSSYADSVVRLLEDAFEGR